MHRMGFWKERIVHENNNNHDLHLLSARSYIQS